MKASRVLAFYLLTVCSVISCSDDEEPASAVCLPVSLTRPTEYTVLQYDNKKRLQSIVHHIDIEPTQENILYNLDGLITHVNMVGQNKQVYRRHQLVYDNLTLKPVQLLTFRSSGAVEVTSFHHDERGQLVQIQVPSAQGPVTYRYEYNDNGNVIRIFYTLAGDSEFLGRENLTFDTSSTLYSNIPSFDFFNVYILKMPPQRNNVLTAKIYSNGPFLRFGSPVDVSYELKYNDDGLVSESVSNYRGLLGEFPFSSVTYECNIAIW